MSVLINWFVTVTVPLFTWLLALKTKVARTSPLKEKEKSNLNQFCEKSTGNLNKLKKVISPQTDVVLCMFIRVYN